MNKHIEDSSTPESHSDPLEIKASLSQSHRPIENTSAQHEPLDPEAEALLTQFFPDGAKDVIHTHLAQAIAGVTYYFKDPARTPERRVRALYMLTVLLRPFKAVPYLVLTMFKGTQHVALLVYHDAGARALPTSIRFTADYIERREAGGKATIEKSVPHNIRRHEVPLGSSTETRWSEFPWGMVLPGEFA